MIQMFVVILLYVIFVVFCVALLARFLFNLCETFTWTNKGYTVVLHTFFSLEMFNNKKNP